MLAIEEQSRLEISKAAVDAEALATVLECGEVWIASFKLVD